MSRKELKQNQNYQIKYYENHRCIERSFMKKETIEQLLNKKITVEIYDGIHYEIVR